MAGKPKKTLSKYDLEFLARTFAAREAAGFTQERMAARLGGLTQDHYKQFEIRTALPHHLVHPFLEIAKVSFEYLFTGRAEGPAWRARYEVLAERQKGKKKGKIAA